MLNELNDRLSRAAQARAAGEKAKRRVSELEKEYRQAQADVARLKEQAAREDADVERLERSSLTGLFWDMLGNKEERLRKERQEALAAQLKYHEATARLESLQGDLERARQELKSQQSGEAEYQSLMQAKEAAIQGAGGSGARELLQFGEREQELRWQVQQLQEAVVAGRRADAALARVVDSLQSAEGWGTWDMLGGGLIATAIKHSRIDDARNHVYAAQQELAAFRRELKDVAADIRLDDVGIDGFTKFADFFFDNLITDWVVQSRIHNSLESVRESRRQVSSWLSWLDQSLRQANGELEALKTERTAFIERFQA